MSAPNIVTSALPSMAQDINADPTEWLPDNSSDQDTLIVSGGFVQQAGSDRFTRGINAFVVANEDGPVTAHMTIRGKLEAITL